MDIEASVETLSFQLSAMEGASETSTQVTDMSTCPRILLYKNSKYALDQERRLRVELANSKRQKNRSTKFNESRNLEDSPNLWSSKNKGEIPTKNFNYRYARLMWAEWFLFKHPEFESQYLFKLCPKGRHVFVVASKGQTNIYSRAGLCLATLLTRLPGGGLGQSSSQMHRNETMLDCIMVGIPSAAMTHKHLSENGNLHVDDDHPMVSETLVLMVLDLVCFRSVNYSRQPFYERCSWLESFHKDQVEAFEPGDVARFEIVPSYACDQTTMNAVLSNPPPFDLDGVLFYHHAVIYRKGGTPLVGWLKPYMLPEWFPEVTVHADYLRDMAPDYQDYITDIRLYKQATTQYKRKQKAENLEEASVDSMK